VRRLALLLVVVAVAGLAAGCGGGDDGDGGETAAATGAAEACAKDQLELVNPGTLTIATGDPAFTPWFEGGTSGGSEFEANDPTNGQGYESAVAYALARELGFSKADVDWIAVPFNRTFAPGPKNFDFAMQQISYSRARARVVDFSRSYYHVNQALVAVEDAEIANATTTSELTDAKLGAVVGTTSYQYIVDNINPSSQPSVYDNLADNVAALQNEQIDGLVTDFPSAYYIANVQLDNAKLVGRFPTVGEQEYFGLTFEKGSSLVNCVDRALDTLEQDGTLERLEQRWITSKAQAPLIQAG